MSKIDEIRGEMVKAMKAKDKKRKDVLSLLLAELKNVEINNRTPLTDEEGAQVILKQIKQLKETKSLTPADRTAFAILIGYSLIKFIKRAFCIKAFSIYKRMCRTAYTKIFVTIPVFKIMLALHTIF